MGRFDTTEGVGGGDAGPDDDDTDDDRTLDRSLRPRKEFNTEAVVASVSPAQAVIVVERALVDLAHGRPPLQIAYASGGALSDLAGAALAALASRFLAVGTPRTFGIVGAAAEHCLATHASYFAPRELRRGDVRAACAADIVCVANPTVTIDPTWLRSGTHVNLLAGKLDTAALPHAIVVDVAALATIVAGQRDGRQLDELTIFRADDLTLAERAIARAAAGA
jgi:hypothetical protein